MNSQEESVAGARARTESPTPPAPDAGYLSHQMSCWHLLILGTMKGRLMASGSRSAPTRRRMKSAFGLGCAVCLASAAILSTAGCSSAPKPAADLNPSSSQRPSPVLLRMYELKSATAFNQADFMSLYQADQATLGAELITREEVMLQPGETRPFAKKLSVDTRFIGVVAAYRNLEQATWRSITAVQPGRTQSITIRAEPLSVSATVSR